MITETSFNDKNAYNISDFLSTGNTLPYILNHKVIYFHAKLNIAGIIVLFQLVYLPKSYNTKPMSLPLGFKYFLHKFNSSKHQLVKLPTSVNITITVGKSLLCDKGIMGIY